MMKRIWALVIVLALCLSVCACNAHNDTAENIVNEPSSQQSAEAVDVQEESNEIVAYAYDGDPVDLITIEEIILTPEKFSNGNIQLHMDIKVRNTSGVELVAGGSDGMKIWYNCLDENGDIVETLNGAAGHSNSIKAGQADWIRRGFNEEDLKKIKKVEFYGYHTKLYVAPEYEFTNPITLNLQDLVNWDKVKSD